MDTIMTPLCLYASKPCLAPRSLKDSGELHRLCEFHRAKANDTQRRWHARQQTGTATDTPMRVKRARKASDVALAVPTVTPSTQRRRHHRETAIDVFEMAQRALHTPGPLVDFAPASRDTDVWSDEDMTMLDDFFDGVDERLLDDDATKYTGMAASNAFPSDWWKELQSFPAVMP